MNGYKDLLYLLKERVKRVVVAKRVGGGGGCGEISGDGRRLDLEW